MGIDHMGSQTFILIRVRELIELNVNVHESKFSWHVQGAYLHH